MTPSAAYRAPVRSAAASTIFWRTASSESSDESAIPASRSARRRSDVCGMRQLSSGLLVSVRSECSTSRQEVKAVRLVQVAGARARDAQVAVLPHDAVAARIDDDHALVPVVVRGDQPVGEPDRERRLVQLVLSARGAEAPEQTALAGDDGDRAR